MGLNAIEKVSVYVFSLDIVVKGNTTRYFDFIYYTTREYILFSHFFVIWLATK